jgi:hypothetical protein
MKLIQYIRENWLVVLYVAAFVVLVYLGPGCRFIHAEPGECVGGIVELNTWRTSGAAPCLGGEARIEEHGAKLYAICSCAAARDAGTE